MLLPSGPAPVFRSTNCSRVSGDLPLYDLLPPDPGEGAAWIQKAGGGGGGSGGGGVFITVKRNVTLLRFQITESDVKVRNIKRGDLRFL